MSTEKSQVGPDGAFGWAARDASGVLSPFNFSRRTVGDDDIKLKVLFCGVCHSDLHFIKNEFASSLYPLVSQLVPIYDFQIRRRKTVAGSAGGGITGIQDMLDFAGKHNITADIELIPMNFVNEAMERLAKGDVKYRFVIDVANTLET